MMGLGDDDDNDNDDDDGPIFPAAEYVMPIWKSETVLHFAFREHFMKIGAYADGEGGWGRGYGDETNHI